MYTFLRVHLACFRVTIKASPNSLPLHMRIEGNSKWSKMKIDSVVIVKNVVKTCLVGRLWNCLLFNRNHVIIFVFYLLQSFMNSFIALNILPIILWHNDSIMYYNQMIILFFFNTIHLYRGIKLSENIFSQ